MSNQSIFPLLFLGKSVRGGLNMDALSSLSSNKDSLIRNILFFVSWFISHKLILNEKPWVESGIWNTVAPVWLARRNTIGNAEQSR